MRRANIENHEAEQLERLRAVDSFQSTRSPPPVPAGYHFSQEEISRFSDSDEDSPSLARAFSFARGARRRHAKAPNASLNCVRLMPSTDILNHITKDQENDEPKPTLARSVTNAAAQALAASESLKSPTLPRFQRSSSEIKEKKEPEDKQRYEDLKRRGMVPPWKLMRENRTKSREGSFLTAGTLRKSKEDRKTKPKRSNTVADPETVRSKRQGTIFFAT